MAAAAATLDEVLRVDRFVCEAPVIDGAVIRLPYTAYAGSARIARLTEVIELPQAPEGPAAAPVVRLLSLAASLSYFKAFAPAVFAVPAGLTAAERAYITALIAGGLGEYAFTNRVPEVLDTAVDAPELRESVRRGAAEGAIERPLVAVGGGKDSIVSIETVKRAGLAASLFAVNVKQPMLDTARVAGLPVAEVKRTLDPQLFALNKIGAPNGHIPVTAVNSLIAILTAIARGDDAVIFSNEASASYGNVEWGGRHINHQWSKSLEAERLLRETLPHDAPQYFSLLRPLTEIRIARGFAGLTDYHDVVTSCNRAFRITADGGTRWCADCPKCRFVFLMLAPFLSRDALLRVFEGHDMFSDDAQRRGFLELLGSDGTVKPFECVGEPEECAVALSYLREHEDWKDHPLVNDEAFVRLAADPASRDRVFGWRDDGHCIPESLEAFVREV